MTILEANRKLCLKQQTELRKLLTAPDPFENAMRLFLTQHAMLNSAEMEQTGLWSFEDAIVEGLTEEQFRYVPPKEEHSIAWLIWHTARCEDITMNVLVAGLPQILLSEGRLDGLKAGIVHSGNRMERSELESFSKAIDLAALRAYRQAVGRRTREIVRRLGPADLKRKVEKGRIQQVWQQGAVVEAAGEIVEYWSKRDVAGLLLMPATRHPLVHLNEALELKSKLS